jgi:hypothetical protein
MNTIPSPTFRERKGEGLFCGQSLWSTIAMAACALDTRDAAPSSDFEGG